MITYNSSNDVTKFEAATLVSLLYDRSLKVKIFNHDLSFILHISSSTVSCLY